MSESKRRDWSGRLCVASIFGAAVCGVYAMSGVSGASQPEDAWPEKLLLDWGAGVAGVMALALMVAAGWLFRQRW